MAWECKAHDVRKKGPPLRRPNNADPGCVLLTNIAVNVIWQGTMQRLVKGVACIGNESAAKTTLPIPRLPLRYTIHKDSMGMFTTGIMKRMATAPWYNDCTLQSVPKGSLRSKTSHSLVPNDTCGPCRCTKTDIGRETGYVLPIGRTACLLMLPNRVAATLNKPATFAQC